MSTEKESLSQTWEKRFDDRDDEELQREMWSRSLAQREKAMAQPFKNFSFDDLEPVTKREGPSSGSEK